jgi:hypothetical protein
MSIAHSIRCTIIEATLPTLFPGSRAQKNGLQSGVGLMVENDWPKE